MTLTCRPWFHFTNPFQVVIAWSVIPGLEGIASGIRSCTVLIIVVVGLAIVPVPETKIVYFVEPWYLLYGFYI